jgi:hypothetical protein
MRPHSLASAALLGLAACSVAEPPTPAAAPEPPTPVVQAPPPAATPPPVPAAAPQPSAEELLAERVRRALRDTRKVEGQGVGVRVAGGTVTLYGTAPTADERRRIEEFVAGLEGVQAVVSKLVIVRGS